MRLSSQPPPSATTKLTLAAADAQVKNVQRGHLGIQARVVCAVTTVVKSTVPARYWLVSSIARFCRASATVRVRRDRLLFKDFQQCREFVFHLLKRGQNAVWR